MPSKLTISIETDDGERRDLHHLVVPDLQPHRGSGSRLRAERLASAGIGAISDELDREEREEPGPV